MITCPHCGFIFKESELEVWKPAVGYEGWYEVSTHGRVRRVGKGHSSTFGKINKPTPNIGGYLTLWLCVRGVKTAVMVHLLVARTFIGPPNGLEVNHKDGNKTNNAVTNLEYTTRKLNSGHASSMGLYQRGADRHNARLTETIVRAIRREYAETGMMQKDLARKYDVSNGTVQAVLQRKTWKWVV